MKDEDKPKEQLIIDLAQARRRIAELETSQKELWRMVSALELTEAKCSSEHTQARGTPRKRQERLPESGERYRRLVELSPDTIALYSEGILLFVNKAGARLLGAENPENLIGKPVMDFVHPDYREIVRERVKRMQEQGKTSPLHEEKFIRQDGTFVDVEVTAVPLALHGKPAVQVIARDITERKRAEEKIKSERRRLFSLLDQLPAVVYLQAPDYSIRFSNRCFWDHFGKPMKRACYEVLHLRREPCEGCPTFRVFETKSPLEFEWKRFDGRTYQVYTYPFQDNDGSTLALVLGIDITDRKRAEEALAESEERYRVLFARDITERKTAEEKLRAANQRLFDIIEFLPDATFVIDRDKRVIAWNRAIEEMTGMRKEDIIGKGNYAYAVPFYGKARPILIDLIDMDDSDIELQYNSVERKGNTVFAEAFTPFVYQGRGAYLRASASPLFDGAGNQIGAIQSIRDISHRKEAAEALRLSEELFSKAFHASPSVMIIFAFTNVFTDGIFVDVNDIFTRLTGYSRDEVIGRTTTQLHMWVDPGDLDRIFAMVLKQKEVRNLEANFRIKSGEIRVGLMSAAMIDFRGKPSILVSLNDITEHKQFEKEIARLDRLNLVGEMAAGIGHEIRNPMTTVRGFLQMLGRKEECAGFHDYFKLMIEELDRANFIISEYLSLAKNKPIHLEEKSLNSIVEALYPLIQADALVTDKHVKMELTQIPELPLDEKEIRQLILNLARNGLEAMPPGGSLTIKTYLEGKKVVLSVQDKGKGIQPEVLEKIGTPFFTTKEQGTGLGLAVCYSIAARHNAVIKIKTNTRGTTFYIRFKLPQKQ